jgi:glutaredoxin
LRASVLNEVKEQRSNLAHTGDAAVGVRLLCRKAPRNDFDTTLKLPCKTLDKNTKREYNVNEGLVSVSIPFLFLNAGQVGGGEKRATYHMPQAGRTAVQAWASLDAALMCPICAPQLGTLVVYT